MVVLGGQCISPYLSDIEDAEMKYLGQQSELTRIAATRDESEPRAAPVDELRKTEKASLVGAKSVIFDMSARAASYGWKKTVRFERSGMLARVARRPFVFCAVDMLSKRLKMTQNEASFISSEKAMVIDVQRFKQE